MANKLIHIYLLINPFSNRVFYVGQTVNPEKRLSSHMRERNNSRKLYYIQALGVKPTMRLIRIAETKEEANMIEKKYIKKYCEMGYDLLNSIPTINPDKKRTFNFTLLPSVVAIARKRLAQEKIKNPKISLSSVVEEGLLELINS